MKTVKFLMPVLAVYLLGVSCTRERQVLNKLEGRWKYTQLLVEGYPPGPPEYETYLSFDNCKSGQACLAVLLAYHEGGDTNQSKKSFSLLDEDRFTLDNDTCHIVHLTKTELVFAVKEGGTITQVTLEKQ